MSLLLTLIRTQTLTQEYADFLVVSLRNNSQISHCAKNLIQVKFFCLKYCFLCNNAKIQSRLKVLLYSLCTPLNWMCAKSMQKCANLMNFLLPFLENGNILVFVSVSYHVFDKFQIEHVTCISSFKILVFFHIF